MALKQNKQSRVNIRKLSYFSYRLLAMAAIPIPKKYKSYTFEMLDVDHIDGNHLNNNIENLQWISRSDHSRKTTQQTKDTRNSGGPAKSKPVVVTGASQNALFSIGHIFESGTAAATAIGCGSSASISQATRKKSYWVTDGSKQNRYKFEYYEFRLPFRVCSI